jgi:hypothetical protein
MTFADPLSQAPLPILLFVALWSLITALLGLASGWPVLAREYRAGSRPSGVRLNGQVFRVGPVPERNVTCLAISESGLYLRTLWPFRIFRPPLLIPWPAIKRVRSDRMLWQLRYVIETDSSIPIVISKKAFAAIYPHVSAHVSLA